jgi:RNA polymerase sigma-70 factor (ECF subfamily)
MQDDLPDEQLMRRIAGDDTTAFDQLLRRRQSEVFRYLYRLVDNTTQAEDLTQECFLRVWKARYVYRPTASLRTWLFTIARHLAQDAAKRSGPPVTSWDETTELRARSALSEAVMARLTALDPERILLNRELERLVIRAMEDLPTSLCEVMVLRDLQGRSYEEIAAFVGCPIGTVKSRLYSAREQLRSVILSWRADTEASPGGPTLIRQRQTITPTRHRVQIERAHAAPKEKIMSTVQVELKTLRDELEALRAEVRGQRPKEPEATGWTDVASQQVREILARSGDSRGIGVLRGVILQQDSKSAFVCTGMVTTQEPEDTPTDEQLAEKAAFLGNLTVLRIMARLQKRFLSREPMQMTRSEILADLGVSDSELDTALHLLVKHEWLHWRKNADCEDLYEYAEGEGAFLLLTLP